MTKIAYEKHPVSSERKEELRQKGYKIIDIRFKPADNKQDDDQVDGGGDKSLTISRIKELLGEKGIDIPAGVTRRDDLLALLTDGEQ